MKSESSRSVTRRASALPFSAVAVGITQVLVHKGIIAPSPRFGSLPKVALAGLFGYMGGKMSYMKVCQEKFKNLENSPLGAALRQGHLRNVPPALNQSELGDPNQATPEQPSMEPAPQRKTDYQPPPDNYSNSSDYSYSSASQSSYDPAPFSSSFSESAPSGVRDDNVPREAPYQEDEMPKRRPVLYENLRSKNRENYEVTLTQKGETLLKPQAEASAQPKKDVKKNKYGDAWDE
ncbi:OCIA domain-containing protein 1 isoform X2 [Clupea harengus]|uniref:OCIA domain-containing protein 1 n=1 Tax=Clupea harengus TaxID=7950 RepID=A0A6P8G370_CLUHA|nr:OCIA domain-containing protein 1 isoform X2 [Clupea harengus]